MMANIFVTGGAGAIGSNLCRFLVDKGHSVTVLDDLSSGYAENLENLEVKFIQGSVLDKPLLESLFSQEKFSHVFHLAAFFANQNSIDNPQNDLEVNGIGILNVLQTSVYYQVKRFIYMSSSCVYGNLKEMREDTHLSLFNLDTPYAITKLLGEEYCQFFARHYGLHTICIRLFNSYGPGERPGKYRNVIPNFFQRAIKRESLIITGTGLETRDFNFVGDVVRVMHELSFADIRKGEIINIGNGKKITILDLATYINTITNNPAPIIFRPRREWDEVKDRVADITKARALINYHPTVDLEEGLKATYAWFLKYV